MLVLHIIQVKCNSLIFPNLKIKFLFSYVQALFISLSVVVSMLPIMAKLSAILKSECVITLEFLLLLAREWKGITTMPQKHHFFCNNSSGFDNFFMLASNNNDFKVILMESLLINRHHPSMNKSRYLLPLELFDD